MSTVVERTSSTLEQRLVLAQVGESTLAISALWVAEITRLESAHILELPFYQAPFMGVMHHGGQVIPLVSAAQVLQQGQPNHRVKTTVIRLGEAAGALNQVGVVVDQILGSISRAEVPVDAYQLVETLESSPDEMMLLKQVSLSSDVWKPQRWVT